MNCPLNPYRSQVPRLTLLSWDPDELIRVHLTPCQINKDSTKVKNRLDSMILFIWHMSRSTTKPTIWPVRPAKTQISLGIHPVWSESSPSAWRSLGPNSYPLSAQQRQIRLGECQSWSESFWAHILSCFRPHEESLGRIAIHRAYSEDSDQTGRMTVESTI